MSDRRNSPDDGITIPELIRSLGIEPEPHLSWSIGARAREEYQALHDAPPPKALRQKTSGGGSHCFAIYPQEMRPALERIIREHRIEAAKQGDLFG